MPPPWECPARYTRDASDASRTRQALEKPRKELDVVLFIALGVRSAGIVPGVADALRIDRHERFRVRLDRHPRIVLGLGRVAPIAVEHEDERDRRGAVVPRDVNVGDAIPTRRPDGDGRIPDAERIRAGRRACGGDRRSVRDLPDRRRRESDCRGSRSGAAPRDGIASRRVSRRRSLAPQGRLASRWGRGLARRRQRGSLPRAPSGSHVRDLATLRMFLIRIRCGSRSPLRVEASSVAPTADLMPSGQPRFMDVGTNWTGCRFGSAGESRVAAPVPIASRSGTVLKYSS